MPLIMLTLIDKGFDTLAIVKLKTENAVIVHKPCGKYNILEPFSPKYDYIEVVKEKIPEGVVLYINIPLRMIGQIDKKAFRDWYDGVLNLLQKIADNPQILDINNSCTKAGCPSCWSECRPCMDGWKLFRCYCYYQQRCNYVCYYGFQRCDHNCDNCGIDYQSSMNNDNIQDWQQLYSYFGHHTIYDINGRKVYEGRLNGKLPPLKKGVYFLKGRDGKVRKVVVR